MGYMQYFYKLENMINEICTTGLIDVCRSDEKNALHLRCSVLLLLLEKPGLVISVAPVTQTYMLPLKSIYQHMSYKKKNRKRKLKYKRKIPHVFLVSLSKPKVFFENKLTPLNMVLIMLLVLTRFH